MTDFTMQNHGSIYLLIPNTDDAKTFVQEELAVESWQWFGPGVCVEPRYAEDLEEGIRAHGFTIS
jgi:hypothetical protein